MSDSSEREQKKFSHDAACENQNTMCNNVIRGTVKELERRYKGKTDGEIIMEIRMGTHAGEALFYLLFGRYAEMLYLIFVQQSKLSMEYDDFMLELDIRLFAGHCSAFCSFDETKASFKTYLSKIAHNLLYDMRAKEIPMLDVDAMDYSVSGVDQYELFALLDAINSYPNQDSRYVLMKTIEGYRSKEIAGMLTSRKHEQGSLEVDKQLKPSYVDTLRSRALKSIRCRIVKFEEPCICMSMPSESLRSEGGAHDLMMNEATIPEPHEMAIPRMDMASLFIKNICELYNQMMKG